MARARWTRPPRTISPPSRASAGWPRIAKARGIGTGERARADDADRFAGLQPAGGTGRRDLAADHQAGQVGEVVLARDIVEELADPHGEDRGEKGQTLLGRPPHREGKVRHAGKVAAVGGDGMAEEGDTRQEIEDLAGKESLEAGYRAVGDRHPFGMGAGMDRDAGEPRLVLDQSDDLRFLAADHVAVAVRIAQHQAGNDGDGAATLRLEADGAGGEGGGVGRALNVGSLAPALAAADHAGEDGGYVRPVRDQRLEGLLMPAGECADALVALRLRDDFATLRDEHRANPTGSPVDGDQGA